ncbi:MAG TPA: thioredoxin family protein [Ignavibacteria bacterium]|nr:thioredoxin family protein [Ignavibacteria bacterium]HRF66402.1 thioredoxin family protein [Ignavibacteria bacterium]
MPVSPNELHIGSKAHPFSLPATDGNVYSLRDFDEKDVLCVIFSCNHCPYVKAVEARINSIAGKYSDSSFVLICINSNDDSVYPEDSFDEMKKRSTEKGFVFPYLRDESQTTAKAYDAICTPDIFLYDKERVLKYRGRIDDNWKDGSAVKSKDLERAIELLLAGKEIDFEMVPSMGCSIKWRT